MSVAPPPSSHFTTFRNAFFSGLLLLAPLVVTIWAFSQIIVLVGGTFRPLLEPFVPESLQHLALLWNLLTTVVIVVLVTTLGFVSHYVFGKVFFSAGERFMQSIPGVNAVYNTVKQIVDTFGTKNRNLFNKVVLVEFPRKGAWVMGFLTSKAQSEAQVRTGEEVWTVFIPTSPNPTSGFLLMIPPREIVELEMSVADGMKIVISGGAVVPPWPGKRAESLEPRV
ncbi:MAG TPA: DUF502 domain-containing protein [Opitutaceae bacterium]|nr:DUF502 domain-containing protein [Opitutaceae bacterium]